MEDDIRMPHSKKLISRQFEIEAELYFKLCRLVKAIYELAGCQFMQISGYFPFRTDSKTTLNEVLHAYLLQGHGTPLETTLTPGLSYTLWICFFLQVLYL